MTAMLIVVHGDPVQGTDTHKVTGTLPDGSPYTGKGSFTYTGSMTDGLSDFVRVGGHPVALASSQSSLDPGEIAPGGSHSGPKGTDFDPAGPNVLSLSIVDTPLGTGSPAADAGSAFVTIGGTPVLLDGDPVDSCGGHSTVTAAGQSFVTCAE
ncbi:hypothetical protein ABZX90_09480 [Streptomyces sp. NPDC002935]|uniref:hypothetical protein n=1 Tax=unclassified Streptomyces TaxID=2593676 RepID=UPI003327B44C